MVCAAVQRRAHCGIVGGVFGVQHYGKEARLKILGLLAGKGGHYGDVGVCAVYGKRTLRAGFIGYKTLCAPPLADISPSTSADAETTMKSVSPLCFMYPEAPEPAAGCR